MSDDDEVSKGNASGSYDVGYRKPPKSSRFQPGQSGNPKGRKKGARSAGTIFRSIMDEKITVMEGQTEKKYTRLEALFRQTINRAIKGDARAAGTLMAISRALGYIEPERVDPDAQTAKTLAEEDREILERLLPSRFPQPE